MTDSDLALRDKVSHALLRDPYLARRDLRFESEQGKVKLTGIVHSYYQKQMAQELVRRVDGVSQIENALEVSWL
jgi:osmotically-inducible protein OsmY